MLLAGVMLAAGLVVTSLSVARLSASDPHPLMAQATQPLQSTPGAETKPSAPAEPTTTGTRPSDVPPEPARPESDALKAEDCPVCGSGYVRKRDCASTPSRADF